MLSNSVRLLVTPGSKRLFAVVNPALSSVASSSSSSSSHSSSLSSCSCSSCLLHVPRRFGSHKVPVGPRDPDNIYRRPQVPPYNRPLHINEDMIFTDAQAPQPGLAESSYDSVEIFKILGKAVASFAIMVLIGHLLFAGKNQKYINPVYPYNGLRLELGGVSGSREQYPGKKEEQERLKAGKFY